MLHGVGFVRSWTMTVMRLLPCRHPEAFASSISKRLATQGFLSSAKGREPVGPAAAFLRSTELAATVGVRTPASSVGLMRSRVAGRPLLAQSFHSTLGGTWQCLCNLRARRGREESQSRSHRWNIADTLIHRKFHNARLHCAVEDLQGRRAFELTSTLRTTCKPFPGIQADVQQLSSRHDNESSCDD